MKRFYYCIVSCSFITMCILTVEKSMLTQSTNAMQFVSKLITFASDEVGIGNGETGTGNMCSTTMDHEYIYQTCSSGTLPVRTSVYFKCSNGKYGGCQEGYHNIYYDCNFMTIHEDENITSKTCY